MLPTCAKRYTVGPHVYIRSSPRRAGVISVTVLSRVS